MQFPNAHAHSQSSPIVHFIAPLAGETLGSRVARHHISSGARTLEATFQHLFATRPFQLHHPLPLRMDRLASRLGGDMEGTLAALRASHTVEPLMRVFGIRAKPLANPCRRSSRPPRRPRHLVRVCPECLAEDVQSLGVARIQVAHQIRGADACWRHGDTLVLSCPACERSVERPEDLALAVWQGCNCGHRLWSPTLGRLKHRDLYKQSHARFAVGLLGANGPAVTRHEVFTVYRERALILGERGDCASPFGGALRREMLASYDGESFGPTALDVEANTMERLMEELAIRRHLALAHLLFDSFESYLDALGRVRARGYEAYPAVRSGTALESERQLL